MGSLLETLDPLARLLLEALLNTFWQGMLIAALSWLLLKTLRQASATTRHAVWLVTLLTIGALPFIALLAKKTSGAIVKPAGQSEQTELAERAVQQPPMIAPIESTTLATNEAQLPVSRAPMARFDTPIGQTSPKFAFEHERAGQVDDIASLPSTTSFLTPQRETKGFWNRLVTQLFGGVLPLWLIGTWMIVCGLMLWQIVRSYLSLFRLRQQMGVVPSPLRAQMQRLADIFGIKRNVRLFTSHRVPMPMTIGALRPLVVLPPELARTLLPAEFDSVIAHELAHIKRWDYLTNLLQRLVQAFLFFHPAVWLIGKQLLIERELACDDWAVKMCEPRRYASCLTRLVELLSESKPLAAATGIIFGKHVISRRVEMILNRDRNATTAVSKPTLIYVIGLAALFVAICGLISPVIAVPLGQKPTPQAKKEAKIPAPARPQEPPLPPLPPSPPDAPAVGVARLPEPPNPPEPPAIAILDFDDIQDPVLAPPARRIDSEIGGGIATAPMAPMPALPPGSWGQNPTPRPAIAPLATTIAGWEQDSKNKTPVVPETELLALLSDIVKRDADPNVRNEALQGIYRLRSDAAINTLIQLYDGVSDNKTKGEIIAYLLRREGDNSKAVAKLTAIAKNEKDEELRSRAIRYLGSAKGDDGANTLISIYDSAQDQKTKLYIIRSLGSNKSRKAVDKLVDIAKKDSDPVVRQSAIRAIYNIDSQRYLEVSGARISQLEPGVNLIPPRAFGFDGKVFELDTKRWEEMQKELQKKWEAQSDKWREMMENLQFNGLDKLRLEELNNRLRIEIPKINLQLRELEQLNLQLDQERFNELNSQLRLRQSLLHSKLAGQNASANTTTSESRRLLSALEQEMAKLNAKRSRMQVRKVVQHSSRAPRIVRVSPRIRTLKGLPESRILRTPRIR